MCSVLRCAPRQACSSMGRCTTAEAAARARSLGEPGVNRADHGELW